MKTQSELNLKEEIRGFLKKYIDESQFSNDTNIFTEGFVNSLFAMDLIVFMENNYHFQIDNDDLKMDNFKSVDSIAALIHKNSKASISL